MRLFRQALKGVKFLHSHNWVHGDITPGNIGVTADNHVVLLDFDVSLRFIPGMPFTPLPGSKAYSAPERTMGKHDCSVDIWSLGVVAIEVLLGRYHLDEDWHPWYPHSSLTEKYNWNRKVYVEAVQGIDDCSELWQSKEHQYQPFSKPISQCKYGSAAFAVISALWLPLADVVFEIVYHLIKRMLHFRWAPTDKHRKPRPTAEEALDDNCWKLLDEKSSSLNTASGEH